MTDFQLFLIAVAQVELVIGAIAWSIFPALYWRGAWRQSPYGRHLMRTSLGLAAVLWATLIFQVRTIDLTIALVIQALLFGGIVIEGGIRIKLRLNARRLQMHEEQIARDALTKALQDEPDSA